MVVVQQEIIEMSAFNDNSTRPSGQGFVCHSADAAHVRASPEIQVPKD